MTPAKWHGGASIFKGSHRPFPLRRPGPRTRPSADGDPRPFGNNDHPIVDMEKWLDDEGVQSGMV
jgi:hypothetical protein